jgi:hypothetical protein
MCRSKAEGGRRCRGRSNSRAAAETQLGDFLDAAVAAAPGDSLVQVAEADIAGQAADAITATLQAHGCPRGSGHLLCSALAAVAQAMKAGEDMARTAVTEGVTAALTACGMSRRPARMAGRAAAGTLMKLGPARHWEDIRRAVELQAVTVCPCVAEHPDVQRYCARPLASEALSSVIQEELAGSLPVPSG